MKELPKKPWARPWDHIVRELNVDVNTGLTSAEATDRQREYGRNALREIKARSAWAILWNQFKSLIVVFLAAAVVVSFAFGEFLESAAIGIVIIINAMIGFFTELKGARSIEALRKIGGVTARIRRDGKIHEMPAEELVPGDIVIFEGGDIVTADLRLFRASKLQADESVLTGESVPVAKALEPVAEDALIAERANMLFKGTVLTRGSGEAVVVGTGMNTELGRISSLVEEIEDKTTPLEKRLNQLAHRLIWLCLAIAAFVGTTGILLGKDTFLMIETAIALAVAAIPEGLPIVATMALARGVWRMANRNTLIKQLSAVETLGATSVILTDKTGTLTENRMAVTSLLLASGAIEIDGQAREHNRTFRRNAELIDPAKDEALREALEVAALCNNAYFHEDDQKSKKKSVGDPLEVALLAIAARAGIDREELTGRMPEVREEAFDSDIKMMATFHQDSDKCRVAVKGAPEAVLKVCSTTLAAEDATRISELSDDSRKTWLARSDRMAEDGLRVLALATKDVSTCEAKPYENLRFLGLVGLLDPPRGDVKEAIDMCQDAGVRVIMVTGDQPVTARTIAFAVGLVDQKDVTVLHGGQLNDVLRLPDVEQKRLLDVPIFARVSPKQKLDLIATHQNAGAIVAMTGDGVNDAPALKKADIGIAMGQRGTQVAREAADMILKDDAFASIVLAIEQGRIIFNNIRKFVLYLLSCNLSELAVVTLASVVNAPLPILPLQILFLNVVTDVFPALALAGGEGNFEIMKNPPRDPKEPIVARRHWWEISGYAFTITASVLGALALAFVWLKMPRAQAVTVSFLTLAFSQLWHVFNMRDRSSRFIRNDITRNPFIWGALALCTALLVGAVYLPGLSHVMKVTGPGIRGWTLVVIMSLIPFCIGQARKAMTRRKSSQSSGSP